MAKLFDETTKRQTLRAAWQRIRANGIKSTLHETRDAIEEFERNAEYNIGRIQRQLRNASFVFTEQKGVLKEKASGKKRGIVLASVENRIVERACLDCLQTHVRYVQKVINTPTSVGGVPDRSVPHGLALICSAIADQKRHFVRADISGFFDHIPRTDVIDSLAQHVDDDRFIELLTAATTVTLGNEAALGEDRRVFPTDSEGVAQGSPLSPLFGNILLHSFDEEFNKRGIICVRFIDDFVILGEQASWTKKAFVSARKHLQALGLTCHDPFDSSTPRDKAEHGHVNAGFVFLGYDIYPGLLQPSRQARRALLDAVDRHLWRGKKSINDVLRTQNSFENRQRYAQTLDLLDRVTRGWGNAFAYANSPSAIGDLDRAINARIEKFSDWYRRRMSGADWRTKRRAGGVGLLADIETKTLDELPFRLSDTKKRKPNGLTIIASTDGSVVGTGPHARKDRGPAGWSVVFHENALEYCGHEVHATNNEMELRAVIEALLRTAEGSKVRVRTDSQYVCRAINQGSVLRSNHQLWKTYQKLSEKREVEVVWVRGHVGDPFNERAHCLAREQAEHAQTLAKLRSLPSTAVRVSATG